MKQKRIYAFLIDLLIIAVPSMLLMAIGVFVFKSGFRLFFYWASGLAMALLLLKDITGRSPGKYFMGLRIDAAPGRWVLVLRNLSLILLPLEALVFLVNDERIGDGLFKTKVKVDERSDFQQNVALMAGVFVALLIVYLSARNLAGFYIKQKQEYIITEAFVYGSKAIQEQTGEVIKLSEVPTYTISKNNGQTNVKIETKVYGKKENTGLIIYLTKQEGGQWEIINFEYAKK